MPRRKEPTGSSGRREAVLYARVSSKEQEREGYSIQAQVKLLQGHAQVNDLDIIRDFVDVETAKDVGRTCFGEMVGLLKTTPECRVVLVEKTDRLYRNIKDWVTLDELDLEIHFVKEGVIISPDSRSSDKFMHGIRVLMAKQYIDNLSEEASKGMLEKARQGLWPSWAPLGYINVESPDGRRIIERDDDVAPIVAQLFTMYASGTYSLSDLAAEAEAAGLVSLRKKKPLDKWAISRLLKNPIYCGDIRWRKEVFPGRHEPLVERELWERVAGRFDERANSKVRRVKHTYAFSRLIHCGHCGCSLVGEIKKDKYIYYHCTGYRGKCGEPYVREEVLAQRFGKILKRLQFDEEIITWTAEALRDSHSEQKEFHEAALATLQNKYSRLQNRIHEMYIDKLDGRIDAEFYDVQVAVWRSEQEQVLSAMHKHQVADQSYIEEGIRLLELARKAHGLFLEQPPAEKQRLLQILLSNCTWAHGELTATFRQPFEWFADATAEHRYEKAAGASPSDLLESWRGRRDSNSRPPA